MGKPIKVLSIEQLAKWKGRALRRMKKTYNFDDDWAERRLLDVIKSHEGLRRGVQRPFSGEPFIAKPVRTSKVPPERRREIALAAAKARWAKKK